MLCRSRTGRSASRSCCRSLCALCNTLPLLLLGVPSSLIRPPVLFAATVPSTLPNSTPAVSHQTCSALCSSLLVDGSPVRCCLVQVYTGDGTRTEQCFPVYCKLPMYSFVGPSLAAMPNDCLQVYTGDGSSTKQCSSVYCTGRYECNAFPGMAVLPAACRCILERV